MTVGQVLAKIKAGEAPAKKEGQDAKQENAGAGAAPAESTALDTETQGDSGTPKYPPLYVTHSVAS